MTDPLLDAINAYHAGYAAFEAMDTPTQEDFENYQHLMLDPLAVLDAWMLFDSRGWNYWDYPRLSGNSWESLINQGLSGDGFGKARRVV